MGSGAWTPVDKSAATWTPVDEPTAPPQRTAMDSVKDFTGELWKKVNPVSALYGARDFAGHPIDALKADAAARQQVYQKAEDAFKKGDYAGGSAHLLYSFIPMFGPQLSEAGTQFQQGETAKGAGASAGLGLSIAAPEVAPKAIRAIAPKQALETLAGRMYQSTLKPSPASYTSGEVKSMVQSGLENKIPVSEEGVAKLNQLISDLQDKVKGQIQDGAQQGATVNKFAVTNRLNDAADRLSTQVAPTSHLQALSDIGNDFIASHPAAIPVDEAQAIKSGTYRQISKSYGEQGSAAVEAQKALARGIKEELETQFPEIKGLNAMEGRLINLDGALERAVRRTNNRDILSLGGKVASAGGGSIIGATHGGASAGAGAVTGLFLHHILTDPVIQSKIAIGINNASKGAIPLDAARLRVASYANALGNAAADQQSGDTTNQQ